MTILLQKSSYYFFIAGLLLLANTACMTHRHSVGKGPIGAQGSTDVYDKMKQGYLFWGLIPLQKTRLETPKHGDYQIKSCFNPEDGLISILSCGIVSFRTIKILEYKQCQIAGYDFRVGDKITAKSKDDLILGEIVGIDAQKKRISYLYWNIYGEKCVQATKPNAIEGISEQRYQKQMRDWRKEIERYQYMPGNYAIWPLNEGTEFGVITKLDNRRHKATIQLSNIYNEVVYFKVPYLDIQIIDSYEFEARLEDWEAVKRDYIFEAGEQVRWEWGKEKYREAQVTAVLSNPRQLEIQYRDEKGKLKTAKVNLLQLTKRNN